MHSFAIITTTPNELYAELHNRMPWSLAARPGQLGLGRSLPTRVSSGLCSHSIGGERPVLGGCAQVATEQGQTALRPLFARRRGNKPWS